jgi:Rap1a immunity proteins
MRLMTLVVVAGFLWPSSVFSQGAGTFADGERIYNSCTSTNDGDRSYCAGYVSGMTDALVKMGLACVPANVTLQQAIDVVIAYFRDHAEQRQYPAWYGGRTIFGTAVSLQVNLMFAVA